MRVARGAASLVLLACGWPRAAAAETFSREAAEGVYRVTVEFGCDEADSVTTCKGEARRLFVLGERVPKGGSVAKTFLVDVHRPEFPGGRVALKQREQGTPTWDERLTLEFLGGAAGVRDVVAEPLAADAAVTRVFLAGDSTVTDQAREPYAGWGQMLPSFFGPRAVVANHAESGLALASFRGGRRLDKILAQLRPGDFVLIQFGHNDQKAKERAPPAPSPATRRLLRGVRGPRSATGTAGPCSSPRSPAGGSTMRVQVVESLGDFPEAVRRVAAEKERAAHRPQRDVEAALPGARRRRGARPCSCTCRPAPIRARPRRSADDTHFSSYGGVRDRPLRRRGDPHGRARPRGAARRRRRPAVRSRSSPTRSTRRGDSPRVPSRSWPFPTAGDP
jgi:lysophospholipase L1-like esterase